MERLEFHEHANLFPLLGEVELGKLAESIREQGQQVPIVLHEGKILDGRNRYLACELAGVEAKTVNYEGEDALGFSLAQNLERRHLSESQRAMIAAKVATIRHGGQGGKKFNPPIGGLKISAKDRESAAAELRVGHTSLDRARRVQRDGVPELSVAVERGEVTVSAAEHVAKLPKEEQAEIVAKGPEEVKRKATEMRKAKQEEKPKAPEASTADAVDEKPKRQKKLKVEFDHAEDIWTTAWGILERIHPEDLSREKVLRDIIAYAEKRLQENK